MSNPNRQEISEGKGKPRKIYNESTVAEIEEVLRSKYNQRKFNELCKAIIEFGANDLDIYFTKNKDKLGGTMSFALKSDDKYVEGGDNIELFEDFEFKFDGDVFIFPVQIPMSLNYVSDGNGGQVSIYSVIKDGNIIIGKENIEKGVYMLIDILSHEQQETSEETSGLLEQELESAINMIG